MFTGLFLSLFAGAALAAPASLHERASPSVSIKNGTIVGITSGGVDSFKGIPFAQPPVGSLRLKPPQPLSTSFGTISSKLIPPSCPQFYFDTSTVPTAVLGSILNLPLLQTVQQASEDCLTIDIQRPAGISATAKLPVLFWIFGGGFELGSTQLYDGANIVAKSVALGQPIVWVAVNYRVGGFGFLGGKEIKADGASNLGLKDQRLGLKWVADNIAAFGGDPDKVTIWGESAGAISVFDHTIINGGDHTYNGKPLFRAAIMNSGSVVPAQDIDSAKAQKVYDTVVAKAGCASASSTLECLRGVDYSTLLTAANSVPGILSYRSVDLSYLPRPDPSDNFFPVSPELALDSFAKVPVIIGDQEDEGTLFALFQSNITTETQLVDYLASYFTETTRDVVQGLVSLYPDNITAGSPFNTGIFNSLYPQFKRLAAILGDASFTLTRRLYLEQISSKVKAYSYLSSYFYGLPFLGTGHGTDILPIFFNFGIPSNPTNSILSYYISFVNTLDPNTAAQSVTWPLWTSATKQLVHFNAFYNELITDDFRSSVSTYITAKASEFRLRR